MAGLASLMWLNSSVIMYLRDILDYGETRIMLIVALGGVGVALSIRFWGRAADSFGSVPAMIQLLAGHSLLAVFWLWLTPGWQVTSWLVVPVLVFTTVCNAAFTMVTARGMLCRVRENGRVGYTALWIFSVALANGIPPIIAGWLIDAFGLIGFRLCFLLAGIGGLIAAGCMLRLSPEEGKPPEPALHHLIRPEQPLRSLGRVFWITLGFGRN
jgi:MFS family permease